MKPGRPKKSARGSYPWLATKVAHEMRAALEIMRRVDPCDDERPGFGADWKHAEDAWSHIGVWLCDFCDPDNPATFLRQVVKELEGKLMHSPLDEKIWTAYWRATTSGKLPTFAEFKEQLKKLSGNGSLPADSSLRRSMTRLGLSFSRARPQVPK